MRRRRIRLGSRTAGDTPVRSSLVNRKFSMRTSDRAAIPEAARFPRAVRAANGSLSTATSVASGNLRPTPARNRANPAPGSTTRHGWPWASAHASMESTIAGGVRTAPELRRSRADRRAQDTSPSGSAPGRIACVTRATTSLDGTVPSRIRSASRPLHPGTRDAPSAPQNAASGLSSDTCSSSSPSALTLVAMVDDRLAGPAAASTSWWRRKFRTTLRRSSRRSGVLCLA